MFNEMIGPKKKKSKHFVFPGYILKIIPNPTDFRNDHYWGTEGVVFTPCLSQNRQKIKKLPILINQNPLKFDNGF